MLLRRFIKLEFRNYILNRIAGDVKHPPRRPKVIQIIMFDLESTTALTKGITMAIGGFGPSIAIGLIVSKAMEAIGRTGPHTPASALSWSAQRLHLGGHPWTRPGGT